MVWIGVGLALMLTVECAGRLVLVGSHAKPEKAATSGVRVEHGNHYQLDIRTICNSPLGLIHAYKSSHPGFHTFLLDKCFSCRSFTTVYLKGFPQAI